MRSIRFTKHRWCILLLLLAVICLVASAVYLLTRPHTTPQLIFDIFDDAYKPQDDVIFDFPEFRGRKFMLSAPSIYIQVDGQWEKVIDGQKIYLADLNQDGKREIIATMTFGSGICDERIYVYDVADDMFYCMERRTEYDFDVTLEDGQLVVLRYKYKGMYEQKPALDTGKLVIQKRQLYYVSGSQKLQGTVETHHFNMAFLEEKATEFQNGISQHFSYQIDYNDATRYYLEQHADVFDPFIKNQGETNQGDKWVYFDIPSIQNQDMVQYLLLLNFLMEDNWVQGFPPRYVYIDPEKPDQLFICSELRETKYDDIRSYYEALVAGKCRPHKDTYVMRLDENAIYRWGKDENLYDSLRISQ